MGFAAMVRSFMGYPDEEYEEPEEYPDDGPEAETPEDGPCSEVVLARPERFDDASGIADHLNANRMVLLNLQSTSREVARRLIDFLGGAAYAKGGLLKRVAQNVYLITPYDVECLEEETDGVDSLLF